MNQKQLLIRVICCWEPGLRSYLGSHLLINKPQSPGWIQSILYGAAGAVSAQYQLRSRNTSHDSPSLQCFTTINSLLPNIHFSISQFHQSLRLSLTWYCITGAPLLDQCLWCRDLIADKTDLIISLPPPPGSQLLVPGPLSPRLAQPILASHWSTLRRPGKIETLLSSDWLMGGVTTSILMTLVRQKMLLLFWMSSFV